MTFLGIVLCCFVLTVCSTCVAQQLYSTENDKTVVRRINTFPSAYTATMRQVFEFTLGRLLT